MIRCITPDPQRKKYGYPEAFINKIKGVVGVPKTKGEIANVARRIGVDDTRTLDIRTTQGKRLFGSNQKGIEEWNLSKSKRGVVPQDVVVSVPSKRNGQDFFISNKETSLAPSKWVQDSGGKIKLNPDWDIVGVNRTLDRDGTPMTYVKNTDGTFRPAQDGEEGVFLNVQNPTKSFDGMNNDYIVSNHIDAVEVQPNHFRLVNEASQIISPKYIKEKPNRASGYNNSSVVAPDQRQVTEELKQLGLTSRVAATVGGSVVGNLIEGDEQHGGMFWGGALGFALTTGRVRNSVRNIYNRTVGDGRNEFKEMARQIRREEADRQIIRQAKSVHYTGADADEAREFMQQVGNGLMEQRGNGRVIADAWYKHDFFTSGVGLLKSMGSATANQLERIMYNYDGVKSQMLGRLNRLQNTTFGSSDGKRQSIDTQADFVRRHYGEDVDEQQALEIFGEAGHRIINFRGKLDEQGRFVWDDITAANKTYETDVIRQFDEALLRDEGAMNVLNTYRNFYAETGREQLNNLVESAKRNISENVQERYKTITNEVFETATQSNVSTSQLRKLWKESDAQRAKLWDEALTVKEPSADGMGADVSRYAFERVLKMADEYNRINNYIDNYLPQIQSNRRLLETRADFIQNPRKYFPDYSGPELRSASHEVQERVWDDYIASEKLNLRKDKWRVLDINKKGDEAETRYFASRNDAEKELERLVERMSDDVNVDVLRDYLPRASNVAVDDPESFVRSMRASDGSLKYYIETPQQYRDNGINIFENYNKERVISAYKVQMYEDLQYTSNYMDRSRNDFLPSFMLETNLEKQAEKYALDVGYKMYNTRNKMYDVAEFETEWLGRGTPNRGINSEVTFQDEGVRAKHFNKIRDWYGVVQGLRKDVVRSDNLTTDQLRVLYQEDALTEAKSSIVGNLGVMPFLHGTTLYAPFQPAVVGPMLMGGYKNVGKTYWHFARNPRDLQNVVSEMKNIGTLRETFTNLSPEYKSQVREAHLRDVASPTMLKTMDMSEKIVNWAADFSMVKPFASYFSQARRVGLNNAEWRGFSHAGDEGMEALGLGRLFVGNLIDVSSAEAGVIVAGTMRHVSDLARAVNKMVDEGGVVRANETTINGRRFTLSEVERELELLGVDDARWFARNQGDFENYIERHLLKGEHVEMSDELYQQSAKIMNNIVSTYHGRNKTIRPLSWVNNPYGRLFSRFSIYSQNFGIQYSKLRVFQPLKDWNDRYSPHMREDSNFFELALAGARRNDAKFKQVFGDNWEQAYNEFPVEAVNTFYKVFGAVAMGHAMFLSRAAAIDLMSVVSNEALGNDDYEAWRNVNKRRTLYTDDDGNDITIGDIFTEGPDGYDILKLIQQAFGMAIDVGFGFRWAQILTQDSEHAGRGGLANLTPPTSMLQSAWEYFGDMAHNLEDGHRMRDAAQHTMQFGFRNTPNFGTYYDAQRSILNFVFQKPKNRNLRFSDTDGREIEPIGYDF